jgi:prepilin-type N-terminal cleavage/methylation domain-containing protein/prepilin-type processing-associated H-X9-DG protein
MVRRRAFTLIELLVTVSIIALLIALMLPSLSRAREKSKTVKCMANLHAISLALATYNGQNEGMMPSVKPIFHPDWNPSAANPGGNQLMGWADQLYMEGCFLQRMNKQGLAGAMGDGSGMNNGYSWHYPMWGYGVMQCPKHSKDYQWDSNGKPSDGRYLQGYGLAWCATSGFYDTNSAGQPAPYIVRAQQLHPAHIIVSEGNGSFGVQGAYPVPAHMEVTASAWAKSYGIFERHYENTKFGANYLMADGHVEFSSDYGWAPSPFSFYSSRNWNSYSGPAGHKMARSKIWTHGVSN